MSIIIEREETSYPSTLKAYILSNKDLLYKSKVIINNSTAKAMYSFPLAKRFDKLEKDNSSFFYNIPSTIGKKGTSIGYGKKFDILPPKRGKCDNIYNLPLGFDLTKKSGSPKYTFGYGRDICRKPVCVEVSKSPGPSSYYPYKKFGENGIHYSMSFRYKNRNSLYNYPGPGKYEFQEFNKKGKYSSSDLPNSTLSKFPKSRRFSCSDYKFPGPGTYELEELTKGNGKVYNSKFRTSIGKTMGKKLITVKDKLVTPGPGAYEFFSDFQGFNRANFVKIRKDRKLRRCKSANIFGKNPKMKKPY